MSLGWQWQPRKRQANDSIAASSNGTHPAPLPSDSSDEDIHPSGSDDVSINWRGHLYPKGYPFCLGQHGRIFVSRGLTSVTEV